MKLKSVSEKRGTLIKINGIVISKQAYMEEVPNAEFEYDATHLNANVAQAVKIAQLMGGGTGDAGGHNNLIRGGGGAGPQNL